MFKKPNHRPRCRRGRGGGPRRARLRRLCDRNGVRIGTTRATTGPHRFNLGPQVRFNLHQHGSPTWIAVFSFTNTVLQHGSQCCHSPTRFSNMYQHCVLPYWPCWCMLANRVGGPPTRGSVLVHVGEPCWRTANMCQHAARVRQHVPTHRTSPPTCINTPAQVRQHAPTRRTDPPTCVNTPAQVRQHAPTRRTGPPKCTNTPQGSANMCQHAARVRQHAPARRTCPPTCANTAVLAYVGEPCWRILNLDQGLRLNRCVMQTRLIPMTM